MTDSDTYRVFEGLPSGWTPDLALARLHAALASSDVTQRGITVAGLMITDLLLHKNERYGNSATQPIEIFARGLTPRQRMRVRMDDKVSRMARGLGIAGGDGEHPGVDLVGYLLLDIVAEWQGLE